MAMLKILVLDTNGVCAQANVDLDEALEALFTIVVNCAKKYVVPASIFLFNGFFKIKNTH